MEPGSHDGDSLVSSVIHRPNVLESNSGLGFGAQDFHPPVIDFLSAFTIDVHTYLAMTLEVYHTHKC